MSEANIQELESVIRTIVGRMHDDCVIAVSDGGAEAPLAVTIQAPQDARFLIGKDGQNLKALEQVIRAIWKRRDPDGRQITVDVNDYRKTKATEIVALVHETARRVRDTRRPEALDPMSSYERRIVHTELAAYHDLSTESIGQEPQRRVVVKPL